MKIIVPLVMSGLLLTVYTQPARAGLIWANGTPASITTNCDSSPDVCNGPAGNTGWTIYDDFTIGQATTISGFTYDSDFKVGSASDYITTDWSIWDVDPLNLLGFPALATGTATATVGTDSSGSVTVTSFTVTGLSVDLVSANTYWLGYSNVLQSDGAETVAVMSNDTTDLPGYEQGSDDGTVGFDKLGNTVFTVEGTADPAGGGPGGGDPPTPEPASWLLAAGAIGWLAKRRLLSA